MRFKVGLVDKINPVLLAQVVPGGVIRIMGCADGINVMLFKQFDILYHPADGNGPAVVRVVFMAVHTEKLNRSAID